jgi:hypothetical protein
MRTHSSAKAKENGHASFDEVNSRFVFPEHITTANRAMKSALILFRLSRIPARRRTHIIAIPITTTKTTTHSSAAVGRPDLSATVAAALPFPSKAGIVPTA